MQETGPTKRLDDSYLFEMAGIADRYNNVRFPILDAPTPLSVCQAVIRSRVIAVCTTYVLHGSICDKRAASTCGHVMPSRAVVSLLAVLALPQLLCMIGL